MLCSSNMSEILKIILYLDCVAALPGQLQLSTAWKLLNQNSNNNINKVSHLTLINKTRAGRDIDIDFRPHHVLFKH